MEGMKKKSANIGLLPLLLLILCGCGSEAVFIPDVAFTMGFDQYNEESLSREFPDIPRLLDKEGFRTSLFLIDSAGPLWEEELAGATASFHVWAPLRGPEAVRFHRDRPGTSGLWLALGDNILAGSAPDNLMVLIPRGETAWFQLNSVLIKEGYTRVAGVFSSSAAEVSGVADLMNRQLEWFFLLKEPADVENALAFLKNQASGKADLIILAAGEADAQLYQELVHWKVPLVLEAPFPGVESNPMVKGVIVTAWAAGFRGVSLEAGETQGGRYYFDRQLWWRGGKSLQPLE